ncbi:MAG: hypothetical protein NC402_05145 [Prevotella sp.]|nr:hypothetical protein [Prevotella sp.]MCM1074113.1 hypothetical protein [Ruminococcus sp.]
MEFKLIIKALPAACFSFLLSCSGHTDNSADAVGKPADTHQAKEEHSRMYVMLEDSVESLQRQLDDITANSGEVRNEFDALLERFRLINDPLLVEPYRVPAGWENYDTTGRQGIMARVLENGTVEIIVTASSDFDTIKFSSNGQSEASKSVPSGNALHNTIGSLTRVAFNNAADLAKFVAEHISDPVILHCGSAKTFTLNDKQKRMIADTYEFTRLYNKLNELERRQSVITNKLQFFQRRLDERNNK